MENSSGVSRELVGKHEGNRPFGNVEVDGRTILKWILETGWEDGDWFDLAQDRDKRLAGMNTITNFLFPLNAGNFLPAEELFVMSAFQEGLFYMPPFSVEQQPKSDPGRSIVEVYTSHTITHTHTHTPVGLL